MITLNSIQKRAKPIKKLNVKNDSKEFFFDLAGFFQEIINITPQAYFAKKSVNFV